MPSTLIQPGRSSGGHLFAGAGLPKSPAIWKSSWPKYVGSHSQFSRPPSAKDLSSSLASWRAVGMERLFPLARSNPIQSALN